MPEALSPLGRSVLNLRQLLGLGNGRWGDVGTLRGREAAFEEAYRASRRWARLFSRRPSYRGTELLHSEDGVYLVVDRWASRLRRFHFLADYGALDEAGPELAEKEPLGAFSPPIGS